MRAATTVEPDGWAIKNCRERAGLTQAELAELTARNGKPVPPNRRVTISNLERGSKKFASLRFIALLAKALEVEPEALIKSADDEAAA